MLKYVLGHLGRSDGDVDGYGEAKLNNVYYVLGLYSMCVDRPSIGSYAR